LVVPVAARGNDVALAEVVTREAKVIARERAIRADQASVVAGNRRVITSVVARGAAQIGREVARRSNEWLEDNGLSLNFTDLLGDDPLGHLLENEETLLDDLDALGVTNDFLFLNNNLLGDETREVIGTVEVVEAVERRNSTPVFERVVSTSVQALGLGVERQGEHAASQSSHEDKRSGDLGEHDGYNCVG